MQGERRALTPGSFRLPGRGPQKTMTRATRSISTNIALDIFPYGNILWLMARAATTTDVFNAIAEPRRREIIDVLFDGKGHAVGEVVERLGLAQPAVSKHLGVLRKVGIVVVTRQGPLRLYRLEAKELKPVHDWVRQYQRFWAHHLDRIKLSAERKVKNKEK
jgi:DNA-binding transcriptional ArsR family regulator